MKMIAEIYDAFRAANVDEELARKAAEVVAETDTMRDLQGDMLRLSELVKNRFNILYILFGILITLNAAALWFGLRAAVQS